MPSHTHHALLDTLKNGIIVSVQAEQHEPFYQDSPFLAMVESVLNGGARGLRLAGAHHIQLVRQHFGADIPIIGITKPEPLPKNWQEIVYITPTMLEVSQLVDAGAPIIAIDATQRPRPDGVSLPNFVKSIRESYPELLIMADISTLEEGHYAESLGLDLISTTLSGYTQESQKTAHSTEPDFTLLKALVTTCQTPVVLEGRIWTPEHVEKAYALGAFSVVIGSAITRPHQITKRFVSAQHSESCVRNP